MRGVHDGAIGVCNADGLCGGTFVEDVSRDGAEMCSAAAIGNGNGVGRNDVGRGGPTGIVDIQESECSLITLDRLGVARWGAEVGSPRRQLVSEAAAGASEAES